MNRLVKFVTLILTLCLVLSLAPLSVSADAAYTYSVTVYAGKEGTFANGSDTYTLTGLEYGQVVSLANVVDSVRLKSGSKYYVKGIRLSGHDNSEVAGSAFKVTGDAMYVVAYGVKGNLVEYTVNYVDSTGKVLAPSRTFYGNVGDKAIAAYEYIEGYQPLSYNLAKTLKANAAENVFTFTYVKAPTPTVIVLPGTGNGNTGNDNNNAGNNNNNVVPDIDDNTATQPGDLDNGNATVVENNTENEQSAGTQEIIDLDELETPTSEAPEDFEPEGGFFSHVAEAFQGWSPWAYIALAAGGFGILTFLFYLLFSPKKNKKRS